MSKTNLLQETERLLKNNNKTDKDIVWVGVPNEWFCTWNEFKELAKDINYDNGYGSHEIVHDLMVVGTHFWLERGEYDGSEWWEYKSRPEAPDTHQVRRNSIFVGYED